MLCVNGHVHVVKICLVCTIPVKHSYHFIFLLAAIFLQRRVYVFVLFDHTSEILIPVLSCANSVLYVV